MLIAYIVPNALWAHSESKSLRQPVFLREAQHNVDPNEQMGRAKYVVGHRADRIIMSQLWRRG